jgi:NAD-dependent deacetylase
VIFFGENIPEVALRRAKELTMKCEIMLVVGTSAEVMPASQFPSMAKARGALIVEINLESTNLTNRVTDHFIEGKAGKVLPELLKKVEELI